jgi:asparagine synthase (glutamine-hydrolysing)
MCGIAGLYVFGGAGAEILAASTQAMTDAIAYRGPDSDGQWVDAEAGIALGHRRLAVVDLTPTGAQPMTSANGRVVITYNGELYNAAEMAAELAMPLRGTSDTEVLVEAISLFGIDGALDRANGLFAFAAFDRSTRTLHLARDRLGIKPLYWTRQGATLAFASELKALRALKNLDFTLDLESLTAYLRHACVPAPRTIYRNVMKLLPGERLEANASGVKTRRYWDLPAVAQGGQTDCDLRPQAEIIDELDALLTDVVERQMVSDVPLGAFLSGGIDSSTVVAMMCKADRGRVKTFSIGFREQAFNEADNARAVAHHLGTDHTEHVFSDADALAIIPKLPVIYDEPFADYSQLPTYLVSQLARKQVTVALSGDGGDENFGGYVRHQTLPQLARLADFIPRGLRTSAASALQLMSPAVWDAVVSPLPDRWRPRHFGEKVHKAATLLEADGPTAMYRSLISQWPYPERVVKDTVEPPGWSELAGGNDLNTAAQVRLLDMMGYLPDDILTKVDRASMAVSLEVRVPLLDHRLVEFTWRLSTRTLIHGGKGKQPLRSVLARYVPPALTERPKMGFGVPVGAWLRGPLRAWAEDLLSPSALAATNIFDPVVVRACLAEHMSGRRNWQGALWTVLQLQAWRTENS